MTQQAPFRPSDDDIHHLIEHDGGAHPKHASNLHTPRDSKLRVQWRSSELQTGPLPNPDPTGARAAIHPRFDHLEDPER